MSKGYVGSKVSSIEVAQTTLQAIVDGVEDVYPGEQAIATATHLLSDPKSVERQMAVLLPDASTQAH